MSLDYDNINVRVVGEDRLEGWKISPSKAPVFAVAASWGGVSGKPTAYPPADHNHDSRYYTRPEITELMAGKADSDHNHDSRYYQKEPIDTMLAGKSDVDHVHDDRYYTETEADALLARKQDVLTFDQVPTAESINPVTSGGVYDAIQDAGSPTAKVSGSLITLTDATDAPVAGLTVAIEPVQSGEGDPSPDNVRPISGWTECGIASTGKNIICGYFPLACSITNNTVKLLSNEGTTLYCLCQKGQQYRFSCSATYNRFTVAFFDKMPAIGDSTTLYFSNTNPVTAPISGYMIIYVNNAFDINIVNAAQVELGSTATTYEPYQGQIVTIDLGGARYGGMLDVTTGVLTVTHGHIASYNGETLPGKWISDRDVYAVGTTPTTGAQVVYELATPQTIQLTPAEVRTLVGLNNIWADTGDITSLTYWKVAGKGIAEAIDNTAKAAQYHNDMTHAMLTVTETSMTATRNYTAGDILIVGDTLYKATANIASGSDMTNYVTQVTLAEWILGLIS